MTELNYEIRMASNQASKLYVYKVLLFPLGKAHYCLFQGVTLQ